MTEILAFALSLVLNVALSLGIVLWDERRLPPERLERAWPASTRALAVVAFGPLALPVHFGRTRRSVGGVLLGLVAAAFVFAVDAGAAVTLDAVFDVSPDAATQ